MSEKKIEMINLQSKVNIAKKNVEETKKIYRQEQKIFDKVVGNNERAEKRKRQERIVAFRMNWAAKKIQQYWRKWRKDMSRRRRRSSKKKPKK